MRSIDEPLTAEEFQSLREVSLPNDLRRAIPMQHRIKLVDLEYVGLGHDGLSLTPLGQARIWNGNK